MEPKNISKPQNKKQYIITPRGWSGDENQALYTVESKIELMKQMAQAFQCEISELDEPETVTIYTNGDGTFSIGTSDTRCVVDGEGWIVEEGAYRFESVLNAK